MTSDELCNNIRYDVSFVVFVMFIHDVYTYVIFFGNIIGGKKEGENDKTEAKEMNE